MEIKTVTSDIFNSNMYIISDRGHAIIVDPCRDLTDFDESLVYDWIFLTHEHYDHISGVKLWKEKSKARIMCSHSCAENIMDSRKNLSNHFDAFNELQTFYPKYEGEKIEGFTCEADEFFTECTSFEWQGHEIEMMECPGHSKGSILIIIDNQVLFSGDSLLKDYPTACRFPGGSTKQWKKEGIPIIRSLDKELMVYPGHFGSFLLNEKLLKDDDYV
ncbi:MBL fold metallo-hydrolase [Butyrivibrio proteoclasticus]|uniref:MBL fold metallo-hydrolase n=1 Tax=Butyrivibrio proteoclasticus TaxID=43305 RepID=UPI000684095F|nr:MBL fold metallo-hydrolase [Butyrivibrio proteoclasticus]